MKTTMFGKIPRPKALRFPKNFPQFTDQLAAAASSFAFQLDIIFLKTQVKLTSSYENEKLRYFLPRNSQIDFHRIHRITSERQLSSRSCIMGILAWRVYQ